MDVAAAVQGVVLAGGRGSRLGEPKPRALLNGRPMAMYVVAAMHAAGLPVSLVAKGPRPLDPEPGEAGYRVIIEPAEPVHPLAGIVRALEVLDAPIVVCPCDLPFVPPGVLAWLAAQDSSPVTVCRVGGRLQPLVGRYDPSVLDELRAALAESGPAHRVISALGARARIAEEGFLSRFGDPLVAFSDVDTPDDLLGARRRVSEQGGA